MKLPRGTGRGASDSMPDARWMTREEIAKLTYQNGKASILLGKEEGALIGWEDDRHLITVAGSRAGKSSTCLKPNLRRWTGSVLCIDPKGELAAETALHRAAMGQEVIILDPFEEVEGDAARFRKRFDPVSEVLAGSADEVIDNTALLADALIIPNKGDTSDHWTMSAKNVWRGLMLHAMALGKSDVLNTVRQWITLPLDSEDSEVETLTDIFEDMIHSKAFDGVVAGVGGTLHGKPKGEKGSILSTATEQTAFLDSKLMKEHLNGSDFTTLRILKQRPTTIYLVLPASRMATHFRWLRAILTLAMASLENEPHAMPAPVLFILEEFPQLGYMRQIEAAAGLMAGYNVKLWTVLQDLSQLKSQYRDSWETFIGNAGIVQAFGNTDATTLEYISKALGTLPVVKQIGPSGPPSSLSGSREQENSAPLLAPFEVGQFTARDTGKQIILFAGKPPAYIDRMHFE
jgi:type IV secretion system protein VirD4